MHFLARPAAVACLFLSASLLAIPRRGATLVYGNGVNDHGRLRLREAVAGAYSATIAVAGLLAAALVVLRTKLRRSGRVGIVLALSMTASCVLTTEVVAGQLIGGHGGVFYSIDVSTGDRTIVLGSSEFSPLYQNGVNGLAFNSKDQLFYATDYLPISRPRGTFDPVIVRHLYQINLDEQTIQKIPIGGHRFTNEFDTIDGLEYDSRRNVFWGVVRNSNELLRIDAQTFDAAVVGQFSRPALIGGLAYDRTTDTLYGVEDFADFAKTQSQLVSINVDTLEITSIGPFGLGLGLIDLDSLAFDPKQRVLYSINDQWEPHQQLVRIDPSTGLATAIGPPLVDVYATYQGLTYVVPEPKAATTAVAGSLFASLAVLKRKLGRIRQRAYSSSRFTSLTSARRKGSTSVTRPTV